MRSLFNRHKSKSAKQIINPIQGLLTSHIEIISGAEMTVEGCKGVAEYTDEFLRLDLSDDILMIFGENLQIVLFEGGTVLVRGDITSLEFCG